MNYNDIPSKSEVMGWNSESLANYLKRMRLSGCDTVVKRSGMNGAKFLTMSSNDLQKFPKVHVPLLSKLSNDINQGGKKKGLFHRTQPPPHPNHSFVQQPEAWNSEEFDEDSDPDYEEPDAENCEDNYICAVQEDQGEFDDEGEYDYELPPSEAPTEIPSHFRTSKPLDESDYIDSARSCPPKDRTIQPPQRPNTSHPANSKLLPTAPRPDSSSHRPTPPSNKSKSPGAAPQIDRRTKPRSSGFSKTSPEVSEGRNYPVNPHAASQEPKMTSRLPSRQLESPCPPPEENITFHNSYTAQDMDPQWYVGPMTRGEAEVSLRQINKDGAFLIRDSSKNATDQPYTLMVLNKQKVYNIQLRFHGNKDGYSLGTGLGGTETFPSVRDMVTFFTKTHLMLIDATERGTGAQHQCCLMHPVRR